MASDTPTASWLWTTSRCGPLKRHGLGPSAMVVGPPSTANFGSVSWSDQITRQKGKERKVVEILDSDDESPLRQSQPSPEGKGNEVAEVLDTNHVSFSFSFESQAGRTGHTVILPSSKILKSETPHVPSITTVKYDGRTSSAIQPSIEGEDTTNGEDFDYASTANSDKIPPNTEPTSRAMSALGKRKATPLPGPERGAKRFSTLVAEPNISGTYDNPIIVSDPEDSGEGTESYSDPNLEAHRSCSVEYPDIRSSRSSSGDFCQARLRIVEDQMPHDFVADGDEFL
ncbi:hypothetical protein QBC45DRAFT_419694 [Copromyces sp. CBS 386.78]|nr:hypothetical protein QBC45DRAFT_419694 [Copromyces sp. CBS 386.78]